MLGSNLVEVISVIPSQVHQTLLNLNEKLNVEMVRSCQATVRHYNIIFGRIKMSTSSFFLKKKIKART